MDQLRFLTEIEDALIGYLSGVIGGKEFVLKFDNLMADEKPSDLSPAIAKLLDEFQLEVSLYVENPEFRIEDPLYYGPDELVRKVQMFRTQFKKVREGNSLRG